MAITSGDNANNCEDNGNNNGDQGNNSGDNGNNNANGDNGNNTGKSRKKIMTHDQVRPSSRYSHWPTPDDLCIFNITTY